MTNHNLSWLKNVLAALLVACTLLTFSACAEEEPDVEVEEVEPIEPVEPIAPLDTAGGLVDTTMADTTGMIE